MEVTRDSWASTPPDDPLDNGALACTTSARERDATKAEAERGLLRDLAGEVIGNHDGAWQSFATSTQFAVGKETFQPCE